MEDKQLLEYKEYLEKIINKFSKDDMIDESNLSKILDQLKKDNINITYKFDNEDYWLDASESIWIRVLCIYFLDSEIYHISLDEFQDNNGKLMLIRVLLYCICSINNIKRINKLVPIKYFN